MKEHSIVQRDIARSLSRSALWNLSGVALPAALGLLIVPQLVHRLGIERFGLLSICWLVVGYFSLLDMGLGRALTRDVAAMRVSAAHSEVAALVRGAAIAAALIALPVAVAMLLAVEPLVGLFRPSTEAIAGEAKWTMLILAGSLPVVLGSVILAAALEAFQRFDVLNWIRIPAGALNFLAPLAVVWFSPHLPSVVLAVVTCRLLQFVALRWACSVIVPGWRAGNRPAWGRLAGLFSFGKWLMVSSVISPLMEYFDRFAISFALGSAVVAYYTVPYDVLTRTLLIPSAMCSVMFPAIAEVRHSRPAQIGVVYRTVFARIAALMVPLAAVLFVFAPELLTFWLGAEFAARSADVTRLLALGVLANSFARIPFTHVQSEGHADWSAKTHMAELLPYLLALWYAVLHWGLAGVAAVWLVRVVVDAVIFYRLAGVLRPALSAELRLQCGSMLVVLAALLLMVWWSPGLWIRATLVGAVLAAMLFIWQRGRVQRLNGDAQEAEPTENAR